jgi:protein-L-isoaspartate(D-aspartate) O-methyltransferase
MIQIEKLRKETDLARYNMVECQLRPNGVTNVDLVKAFESVSREDFAPPEAQALAYSDADIPLLSKAGPLSQRWLLSPLILGKLLQAVVIHPQDSVLIAGCATGYSLALTSQLARQVTGVEVNDELVKSAAKSMHRLNIVNGKIITGSLEMGYMTDAPYDVILIEGAVAKIPQTLIQQLGTGGRLITVLRNDNGFGHGIIAQNNRGKLSIINKFDANCPYLPSFAPLRKFDL